MNENAKVSTLTSVVLIFLFAFGVLFYQTGEVNDRLDDIQRFNGAIQSGEFSSFRINKDLYIMPKGITLTGKTGYDSLSFTFHKGRLDPTWNLFQTEEVKDEKD